MFTESAYLHQLRVFKREDDISIFISIAVLKLRMRAIVLRFCVGKECNTDYSTNDGLQLTCL